MRTRAARLAVRLRRVWRGYPIRFVALTACYTLTGKLGLALATLHPSATAVWAPAGLALAALVLFGYRLWPAILVGAFLVNVTTAGTVASATGIACGNTLEALLGALLVRRFAHGRHAFDRAQDVIKFALVAGVLSPMVGAAIGISVLTLAHLVDGGHSAMVALTWWLGDAGGNLVVAPALIVWTMARRVRWSRREATEGAFFAAVTVMVMGAVFGSLPLRFTAYPLSFMIVPILVWAAYRFGPREVAAALVVITAAAVAGTLRGNGPFVRDTVNESLLLIQAFAATSSVTMMVLAALVAERKRIQEALHTAYDGLGLQFRRQRADMLGTLQELRREVAARNAAEAALRTSEERFRAVAESALEAIITSDPHGRVVYFNPAAERIFGRRADETLGQSLRQLVPARFQEVHRLSFERLLAAGRGDVVGTTVELHGRRRDGSEFPVELSITSWHAGGERFFTGIVRDVSDRKAAERRLRDSEARLAQAQALASIGSWDWEVVPDRVQASTELCHILGIDADGGPLSSRALLVLVHPDDRAGLEEAFRRCAVFGGSFDLDYRIVRPDRTVRWLHVRGQAMSGLLGPARLHGVVQDITERKQTERRIHELNTHLERRVRERTRQLHRSNEDLKEFASRAAHDLSEPLHSVSKYTERLARRWADEGSPETEEAMRFILEGVTWMRSLIDGLLDYSRVGTEELEAAPVDCEAVLARALTNLERVREESAAVVTHDPLPTLEGDATLLVALFQNLIENAIKFRGERRPLIHVGAERRGAGWHFVIRDNGMGMKAMFLERIFQIFQRLHLREEYPGTGLGLAMCRKIVERHRGSIWAESEPGVGSEFHFMLPAAPRRRRRRAARPAASSHEAA